MTRRVADHEIQRILALVPWIVAHPGTSKHEIAQRFGITDEQLDLDLDLVLMVGVPPYTPGDYIDVEIEYGGAAGAPGGASETSGGASEASGGAAGAPEEFVTLRMAESFRRPVQLTAAEGLAVLTAGRALLAVPGNDPSGPLASGLDKLAHALGYPDVVVELARPAHLDEVRAAVAANDRLEIDYWSAGRDELTTRRVDPFAIFFLQGEWYCSAFCHRANDERLFRVDRIRALHSTGEHFDAPNAVAVPTQIYAARPDDPRVTLRVAAHAGWVTEQVRAEQVITTDDGSLEVTLAVSEPAFLERLLLRLGTAASVTAPVHSMGSASKAARRVLARYRSQAGL